VVSSRTVADGQCEYKPRKSKDAVRWPLADAVKNLMEMVKK